VFSSPDESFRTKAEIPIKLCDMRTVLKFPIYVEIDTDNIDRKIVTDAANQILYPALLGFLGDAKYQRQVLDQFRKATMVTNLTVKLLTEIDLFRDRE